jgi:hypothetical protein
MSWESQFYLAKMSVPHARLTPKDKNVLEEKNVEAQVEVFYKL